MANSKTTLAIIVTGSSTVFIIEKFLFSTLEKESVEMLFVLKSLQTTSVLSVLLFILTISDFLP